MGKIGFLGGTFDPPHLGHLELARAALDTIDLDKVLFSVANISPAKTENPPIASCKDRFAMVKMMIEGYDKIELIDFELKKGGVSYTVDLVKHLKKKYPKASLYMICADDILQNLRFFKDYTYLVEHCYFLVSYRANNNSVNELCDNGTVTKIQGQTPGVSASFLRKNLRKDHSLAKYLAPKVFDFILQKDLYS